MTDPPKKRYLPGLLSESLQRPKARGFVYSPTSPVLYQGLRRWARATGRSLAFGALLTLPVPSELRRRPAARPPLTD